MLLSLSELPQLLQRDHFQTVAKQLKVGDMVFICINILPFRKVAYDTGSWTNHVGIVIDTSGKEPVIAESTFPFSTTTTLSRFIKRSRHGKLAVCRLKSPITVEHHTALRYAVKRRLGILYDAGFNLHSKRQFCSRFVHEVIVETTGQTIGNIQNLGSLFAENPHADLCFWQLWYFGRIPWRRLTITPASMLNSPDVHLIYDGYAHFKPIGD